MGWRLAPGTGYCEVDGQLVFLDLGRDKYLALRGEDRAAFERLRDGGTNDSEAMTRLVATGLLTRCDGDTSLDAASIVVPNRDILDRDPPFDLRLSLRAGLSLLWSRRAMRSERIASTVAELARRKSISKCCSNEAVALAGTYAASRWLIPIEPRCLIDALALDRILLGRGLRTALVFGVRLDPFAAHCWLQTPDYILTGSAADAHNFEPILVVS